MMNSLEMQKKTEELEIIQLNDVHFINELRAFRKMISSLIGAHGNSNIFVTGGGYVQLTSSSSQLMKFSDQFNNPLLQVIINIIKNQDDFGFYVGVMISYILENAVEFENNNSLINREELVNFLMESFAAICNSNRMKIAVSYDSIADFISIVRTILTSKFLHRLSKSSISELSTVIVKSFLYSLDEENMQLMKVVINVVEGRETFKYHPGVLYQLVEYDDDWICHIASKLKSSKIKILLFTTPLIFSEEDTDYEDRYDIKFESDLRKEDIFKILDNAIACDVKIIACQKVINSDVELFLRRKSIIVVHRMGTELAKHVETSTRAFPIGDLKQIVSENVDDLVGVIDGLEVVQCGDRQYLLMKNQSIGTLLLQAPSFLSAQLQIVVEQALRTLQKLSSSPYICPGASCFEISLWIQIQELGLKRFKNLKWEWLLKAFVDASGGKLPLWSDSVYNHAWKDEESSSCNCGLVSRDMATKLNVNWTYLNSFDSKMEFVGNTVDVETLKASSGSVVDLFYAKCNAISISLETCLNLCSIGSVVYRKRL